MTIILWTFVFFAPPAAGRSVANLTEAECHRLEADASRVLGYNGVKPGACYKQGR